MTFNNYLAQSAQAQSPEAIRSLKQAADRLHCIFLSHQTLNQWNALVRAWKDQQTKFDKRDLFRRDFRSNNDKVSKMSDDWCLNTGLESPTMVALGR